MLTEQVGMSPRQVCGGVPWEVLKPDLSLSPGLLGIHLVVHLWDPSLFKRKSPEELVWGANSGLEDESGLAFTVRCPPL